MGLPVGIKKMLQAEVALERYVGEDQWGNNLYAPPTEIRAFIDYVTLSPGSGERGQQIEDESVGRRSLTVDYVGIKVKDRLVFDSRQWSVTQVQSYKDQKGGDLYQEVTAQDQRQG